jgi:hypothetical protein
MEDDVTLTAHIRAEDDATDAIADVEAGFGGLRSTIEDMAAGLADAFEATRSIIGGVAGALTAGFYSATESSLSYAEAIAKVEFLTGETAERSAALISAFRAFGFTTDQATLTVQRLTMRLGAIDQAFHSTGKISASQTQQLKEMGLTVKDLTGAHGDLNVLLPKIIDHMKAMHDPLERDRLAMQLFGRNFGALAPLIRAGGAAFAQAEGDAHKFGVELSEAQVEAFETYSSAIETAKEAVQGFVLEFGVRALPYFQKAEDLIKRVAAWWRALNPAIRESVVHFTSLATVFGGLIGGGEVLGKLAEFASKLPVIGQLIQGTLGPFAMLFSIIGPLVALFLVLQHLFLTNKDAAALLQPVVTMLKIVFDELRATAQVVWDTLKNIATDLLGRSRTSFMELAKVVVNDVLGALHQLQDWLIAARGWIFDHREDIRLWAEKIQDLAGDVVHFLTDVLKPFMDQTGTLKDFILNDLIPALALIVWPTVDPTVQSAWDWLKNNGQTVGAILKDIAAGYLAIKTVGTLSSIVSGVYQFAAAFMAVQAEEGTAIALQRTLGIEAAVNAAKATAAWVASAAKTVAAWAVAAARAVASFALMAADAIIDAGDVAEAWIISSAKTLAAWVATAAKAAAQFALMAAKAVISAVRAGAAWVAEGAIADGATVASAAKMAGAWIASSAVAVASAARAAAGWLLANGAMLVVRAATIAWTAVQWLLNVALSANPIGLIIVAIALLVAGIIWAYKNVGWFRDAVNAAWAVLKVWGAWLLGTLWPIIVNVFGWLKTNIPPIVTGVVKAFQGLATQVANIWSGITATIRTYVNTIISLINNFIRGVNAMTVPSWVPGVGGQHTNIPQIPYLATGGLFGPGYGGQQVAVVGDTRETEIVATLSQAVKAGMAIGHGGGGDQPITVIAETYLDGKLIERRASKVTGKRMRLQGAGLGSAA